MFLVYPFISAMILGTFACIEVDNVWYLASDFNIRCYDKRWTAWAGYAGFMTAVYPLVCLAFVLPCLLACVLFWLRQIS